MDIVLTLNEYLILGLAGGLVICLIIIFWMNRRSRSQSKSVELEVERDKLKILKLDMEAKMYPFTRLSQDQITALRELEDENISLEAEIFARQSLLELKMKNLESRIKEKKIDDMITKVKMEEKRLEE